MCGSYGLLIEIKLLGFNNVFGSRHVNDFAVEGNSFHPQAQTLLFFSVIAQLDCTTCADDAVPG